MISLFAPLEPRYEVGRTLPEHDFVVLPHAEKLPRRLLAFRPAASRGSLAPFGPRDAWLFWCCGVTAELIPVPA